MKKNKNGLFLSFSMITILSLSILYSCSKSSSEQSSQIAKTDIIKVYSQTLSKDEDFIKNFTIDKALFIYKQNPSRPVDDASYQTLANDVAISKTNDDFLKAFKKYDPVNGQTIMTLLLEKQGALLKVRKKFPNLVYLNQGEFNKLFSDSYNRVIIRVAITAHQAGCNTGCCDSYVFATSDCNMDFTINTGFALLAGGITTLGATPVVGAFTLSAGIGAAYMLDLRCNNSAATAYRQCMGYR